MSDTTEVLHLRNLGLTEYETTWRAMQDFTEQRDEETPDELWLLEHHPVYTLGLNGDVRHMIRTTDIPVVKTDRGGQITYHGPGQLIAYVLVDLRRKNLGIRRLVSALENAVIGLLKQYGITAEARRDAPGVYVDGRKIASLGLRVRKGCSYHGLSLNVSSDLSPFSAINPCGYAGLEVTSLTALDVAIQPHEAAAPLTVEIMQTLNYERVVPIRG
ncbi:MULTISPECIES: lipoyl(octanoyl) transferase LipB [unclassified Methylocaldum]|jgi:lipoyl(octanoyl) transferase|uniref:lipoyl(octanoyl) transferase LipB n=1 Tax=unclassified Methylocaldum TaxID=2622260 RepID=UPI000A325B3E|nr:lipoyl(octanoyl) transferase LipB [Methylocaldum sp. RMAD-M]MBP1149487.1 lipoyl(octanoyl) transferase [Methylocaldum sp. RMAD-M]